MLKPYIEVTALTVMCDATAALLDMNQASECDIIHASVNFEDIPWPRAEVSSYPA